MADKNNNGIFSSIDQLMEFGLGMGIARQMMNTMNFMIDNTSVPGVGIQAAQQPAPAQTPPPAVPPVAERQGNYFALIDSLQAGPLTEKQLSDLIRAGKITGQTLMWRPGLDAWMFAQNIPDVNKWLLLCNI